VISSPTILLAATLLSATPALAPPTGVAKTTGPTQPAPADSALIAAENLVGKALFLRGFYTPNNLAYDATGRVEGTPKTTDWTLAAVNILKATRRAQDTLELEGVRVAIRYNPDAHEFQRHPLNDEKMKLLIQVAPDGANTLHQINATFAAIFSIGIDPALQRSMPPLWRHYFDPNLPWTTTTPSPNSNSGTGASAVSGSNSAPDPLAGQTIYPIAPLPPLPGPPAQIVPPALAHQTSSQYTAAARNDKVQGTVQLRLVVDAQGVPQRIAVNHPLGYGLDQQGAEAVAKWRFNPAQRAGQPVASAILVNIDFVTAPSPPR
jgi:TonB family protein